MGYRFGGERTPSTRHYRLPTMPQRAAIPVSRRRREAPLPSSIRGQGSGEVAALDRLRERRVDRSPRVAALTMITTVHSPHPARQDRERLNLLVSTGDWLPDLFGRIRLSHDRGAIDMARLSSGVLSFVQDHDTTKPIGRVLSLVLADDVLYSETEVGSSRRAQDALSEIREGVRSGVSPAFTIDRVRFDESGSDKRIDTTVQLWTPFEISSVTAPRNHRARVPRTREKPDGHRHTTEHRDHKRYGWIIDRRRKAGARAGAGFGQAAPATHPVLQCFDRAQGQGRSRSESIAIGKMAAGI